MNKQTKKDFMMIPLFLLFLSLILSCFLLVISLLIDIPCTSENQLIVVPDQTSDCAFVFMLSSNAYFPCLSVAVHSLQDTGTTKDIIVMVTPNIWSTIGSALRSMGIIVVEINAVSNPNHHTGHHFRDNYTKLRIWQLAQYKKIVYSDSDFIYVKNSDDLCELPGAVSAGRNYYTKKKTWPDPDYFNAGFMVITPGVDTYCDMMESSKDFVSPTGGDQPFQNYYWKDVWEELDYKYDGVNANVYKRTHKEWDKHKIRSIHYTRSTNPCNVRFEDSVREQFDKFLRKGKKATSQPPGLWWQAKESLLEDYPQFIELFNQCGFMAGWDDGGYADGPRHQLGFL